MSKEDKDLDQNVEIEEVLAEAAEIEAAIEEEIAEGGPAEEAEATTEISYGTPKAPSKNSDAERRKKTQGQAKERSNNNNDGKKKGSKRRSRTESTEQASEYTEKVVQVRRVTKVVKGGKKLSFRTTVIIGNEKGKVGVGVGKAAEVLVAIKKAISDARKNVVDIETVANTNTISHSVLGESGGSKVLLKPAADGTGIIAGGTARIVLELAGVGDILAKSKGSKSPLNVARATVDALQQLRSFQEVASARGISVKQMLF